MHPIVVLWAVPRSVSTAFERMIAERGDFKVFSEPFSEHYYFSAERVCSRETDVTPKPSHLYEAKQSEIFEAAKNSPVFVKDMAYHVRPFVDREFVRPFVNTFLVRHPKHVLPSLYRKQPDFQMEETGFEQSYRLFELVREETGKTPVVIDGQDLRNDPGAVVRQYCSEIGIEYQPDALSWSPGKRDGWGKWERWHDRVMDSQGFEKPPEKQPDLSAEPVARAYEHCLPYYEHLAKHKVPLD